MPKRVAETPTDYERPYRPLPVALLNAAGRAARRVGVGGQLDVDSMVAKARRRTGLSSFGDEWFMEPLSVLVRSINEEADLTLLGRLIQRRRIEGALATRLRVEELLRRRPEIRDIDLGRIVVIAGLQRSGTTTLHRLVASHPEMRAVAAWEGLNPMPLPREEPGDPHARIRQALVAERAIAYLAPAFFAVHPAEHDAPEEDVLLLDVSFMSQSAEATMHVPTYARWLEGHGRGLFSDRVDPREIGSHWLAKTVRLVELTDRVRQTADPRRFVDVSYYDLIDNPMAELAKVYERAGIPFGPDARQAAERTSSRNVQHRYGRHVYDAGSFGLTREAIEDRMAPYRQRHGVPVE